MPKGTKSMNRKIIPIEVEKTICPQLWDFPYVSMTKGQVKMCCFTTLHTISDDNLEKYGTDSVINNDHFKKMRLDSLTGVRNEGCKYCWNLEDSGIDSPRQLNYKIYKKYEQTRNFLLDNWNPDINIDSPLLNSDSPHILEIALDTLCDLKCIYCSPYFSSQWAVEDLNNNRLSIVDFKKLTSTADDKFKKLIIDWFHSKNCKNLHGVRISGGEPLINPDLYDILDIVLEQFGENDNPEFGISIVTNGNAKQIHFDRLLDIIPRFTKQILLHLTISMESVEQKAEYIRSGLNWDRFSANVELLFELASKNKNLKINFNPTINALCVADLENFLRWVTELERKWNIKTQIFPQVIKKPEYQNIHILPPHFSSYIKKAIDVISSSHHEKYCTFLKNLEEKIKNNVDEPALRMEFYNEFNRLDSIRGTNFIETFPELKEFYENSKTE
jgi:organic radical activating enzyme